MDYIPGGLVGYIASISTKCQIRVTWRLPLQLIPSFSPYTQLVHCFWQNGSRALSVMWNLKNDDLITYKIEVILNEVGLESLFR
jgi:hypothetical protein